MACKSVSSTSKGGGATLIIAETFGSAGAYVMGRRMADGGAAYSKARTPDAIGGLADSVLHMHTYILWAAVGLAITQIPFIINLFWSINHGRKVNSDNPWAATTLEWQAPTPPPHEIGRGHV